MPQGSPSSQELTTRVVSAFALDTSVIQGAGFSFGRGALARLSEQLPPWMQLWLTDIVAREVMQHRLDAVRRAVLQVNGAYADLRRFLAGTRLDFPTDTERYVSASIDHFDEQLRAFIRSHAGTLLEAKSGQLAADLFKRYFDQNPPFGGGRDKKHEFPDAATLLMLESHARSKGTKVVAVSADDGWKAFARNSEEVYCLGSLRELAELFVATSPRMQAFRADVSRLIATASFKEEARQMVAKQLPILPWTLDARAYGYEVDAGVVNAIVDKFEVITDSLKLWSTSRDETACVAHIAVEVESRLEIEAYAYRHKYKSLEKEDLARTSLVVSQGVELFLALEFFGVSSGVMADDALRNMSVLAEPLPVHLGRVVFPGLPETRWDFEDDIPF